MKYFLIFVITLMSFSCISKKNDQANKTKKQKVCIPGGIVVENDNFKIRFVDNAERFVSLYDRVFKGMNGIAALISKDQHKNIFAHVGMNLEGCHTYPPAGKVHGQPQAPRQAPIDMSRVDSNTVRFFQDAEEGAGLNFEIYFDVHGHYVDQEITVWPNHDIDSSSAFWASYMNQVQNTSLFTRTTENKNVEQRWVELTSAGHGASDGVGVFAREYDPYGMSWADHLKDNPVLRQAVRETPQTRKATLDAGFEPYRSKKIDHFYYGFVDDHVYLMIFKEPEFIMWMSASGNQTVRSPAWDYEFKSGKQKAGEKKTYHVRLVYKPFKGIEDVLEEVERFLD